MDGKFRIGPTGKSVTIRSPKRFAVVVQLVPGGKASVLYRSNKYDQARDNLTRDSRAVLIDTVNRKRRVGPPRPASWNEVKWVDA